MLITHIWADAGHQWALSSLHDYFYSTVSADSLKISCHFIMPTLFSPLCTI